jgi:hypothetical protein
MAAGCGRFGGSVSEAVSAPASSGEVWEIDRDAERQAMPGAVLAYVNGLHVVVLDGKEAYAGMTRLVAESRADGARAFKLPSGLEAVLSPSGPDQLQLRFSSGESVAMRKKK